MQFIVHKCPHCQEYLKIPTGRSALLCMYCGLLVSVPPSRILPSSPSLRRVIGYVLLEVLFVAALSVLIAVRLFSLGVDCYLYILRHRIGWFLWQRPAQSPRHHTAQSGRVLTKTT